MEMTNVEVFDSYFNLLEETLVEHGIKDKPAQIYNCDESGMPLEHKMPKVIALKGAKKVRQCSSGNKTQITVLGCVSAAGQVIPPMVVFSGKRFNHSLSDGEIPGTLYGMSDSGWMDGELFANWFSTHFLKHAVSSRPLLLLLDGHSSHYTLEVVKTAAEHEVIVFCLPPHTTADSQPLDTSCFGPLKTYWSEACRQYLLSNPGRVITKFQFSKLFSEAWSKGMTIHNIVSGFRDTGIYPFNRNAILDKLPKSSTNNSCTPEAVEPTEPTDPTDQSLGDHDRAAFDQEDCDPQFSPDRLRQFEIRYENGYDVFTDESYISWLQEFHPEDLPSLDTMYSSLSPVDPCPEVANNQTDSPTGEYLYV